MITYSFYVIEEKRIDDFLFEPVVQQMLLRLHMDAKLHARYTTCLLLDNLKRQKKKLQMMSFL